MIGLEEQARGGGAFEIAADLDELPAFAVAHGGVGDALELVDGFHHLLEEGGGPSPDSALASICMARLISGRVTSM